MVLRASCRRGLKAQQNRSSAARSCKMSQLVASYERHLGKTRAVFRVSNGRLWLGFGVRVEFVALPLVTQTHRYGTVTPGLMLRSGRLESLSGAWSALGGLKAVFSVRSGTQSRLKRKQTAPQNGRSENRKVFVSHT